MGKLSWKFDVTDAHAKLFGRSFNSIGIRANLFGVTERNSTGLGTTSAKAVLGYYSVYRVEYLKFYDTGVAKRDD